jgi:HD-like signal output (HDOD) protein
MFVDDEPGIRRVYEMLPSFFGDDYDLTIAESGDEALALLSSQRFDVIVSDLQMPEMSGSELLQRVAHRSPSTARVVVSGFPDEITVAKCLTAGHRYFTKPFNPVTLMQSVRALCQAREAVSSDRIREVVGKIEALPTPSETYLQMVRAFNSSTAQISEIAEILAREPSLSAKLLQMTNSVMFGTAQQIVSLEESIQRMGLGALKALILATQVFDFFHQKPGLKAKLQEIWTHSGNVALRARQVAQERGWPAEACEESFFAGLLHDIGRVVMAACPEVERKTLFPEYDLAHDDVSAQFALSHTIDAEAGAYLLSLWGIPDPIANAVRTFRFAGMIQADVPSAGCALALAHELELSPVTLPA